MSEVEPMPEENMWNKAYQKTRNEVGKIQRGDYTYCQACIHRIFKHLIHIFVLGIIVCFLGMVIVIVETRKEEHHLDTKWTRHVDSFTKYMQQNGRYLGFKNFSDKSGMGNVLEKYMSNVSPTIATKAGTVAAFQSFGIFQAAFVHPIFVELQKQSPLSHYNKNDTLDYKINETRFGNGGMETETINTKEFYVQYVSRSLPLVFRGFATDWKLTRDLEDAVKQDINESTGKTEGVANTRANLDNLLEKLFIAPGEEGKKEPKGLPTKWYKIKQTWNAHSRKYEHNQHNTNGQGHYVELWQNIKWLQQRLKEVKDSEIHYLENLDIGYFIFYKNMKEQFGHIPLANFLNYRKRTITMWNNFTRVPRSHEYEQFICVLKGREKFRVVSPIYRQNIFTGIIDGIKATESPLDFFDPANADFPSTSVVNFNEVTLERGDCIYVPAYYYSQSQTVSDGQYDQELDVNGSSETIMITHWYEAHSALVNMVFDGLVDNDWMDTKHKYDSMLSDYVGNIL